VDNFLKLYPDSSRCTGMHAMYSGYVPRYVGCRL